MQKNEERYHFKTHASWLLVAQKGCFLESNNCYDCHWKQNIARTMLYTHVISYIKYEIFCIYVYMNEDLLIRKQSRKMKRAYQQNYLYISAANALKRLKMVSI